MMFTEVCTINANFIVPTMHMLVSVDSSRESSGNRSR